MLSGVVNDESISQILRGISQKRQHGVLVLKKAGREIEVYFFQGRIFDARPKGMSHGEVIEERLKRAHFLDASVEFNGNDYTEVHQELVQQLPAFENKDAYRTLVEHAVLDTLYELQFPDDAVYSLHIQMVSVEREFCPSISVGQVLLDLVSIRDEEVRYHEAFPEGSMVVPQQVSDADLSGDQALLAKYLEKPISVQELYYASCLSLYPFREALLGLEQKGLVHAAAGTSEVQEQNGSTAGQTDADEDFEGGLSADAMAAFMDDDDDLLEAATGSIEEVMQSLESVSDIFGADDDAGELEEIDVPHDEEVEVAASEEVLVADEDDGEDERAAQEEDLEDDIDTDVAVSTTNAQLLQSNGIVSAINIIFVFCLFLVAALAIGNHLGRW